MAKILKIENGQIRSVFDEESKKTFYSIVDSVGIASGSRDPRNYWKVLKNRLKKTQNKLVTECNQLKMKSGDGKFYLTDCAEASTIIKILELISPDDIPSFWRYFDNDSEIMSKNTSPTFPTSVEEKKLTFEKELSYPQLNNKELKNPSVDSGQVVEEFSLLVDAYTTNNFIIIKAFIAGVDVKNISIQVTKNSIRISGSRISPLPSTLERGRGEAVESEKINCEVRELSWGKFSRTLALPQEIKESGMEIEEREDGMLIIKLPLLKQNPNKKIVRMRTI